MTDGLGATCSREFWREIFIFHRVTTFNPWFVGFPLPFEIFSNTLEIFKIKRRPKIFLRHISVNRWVERASTFTIERRCFECDREITVERHSNLFFFWIETTPFFAITWRDIYPQIHTRAIYKVIRNKNILLGFRKKNSRDELEIKQSYL